MKTNCQIKDHNNNDQLLYICTMYNCNENLLCCNDCIDQLHKDHKNSDFVLIENLNELSFYQEIQKLQDKLDYLTYLSTLYINYFTSKIKQISKTKHLNVKKKQSNENQLIRINSKVQDQLNQIEQNYFEMFQTFQLINNEQNLNLDPLLKGHELVFNRNFNEALDQYKIASNKYPQSSLINRKQCECLSQLCREEEAQELINLNLTIHPYDSQSYLVKARLSNSYPRIKETQKDCYDQAIEMLPNFLDLMQERNDVLEYYDSNSVITSLDFLQSINNSVLHIYVRKIELLLGYELFDRCIECCEELINTNYDYFPKEIFRILYRFQQNLRRIDFGSFIEYTQMIQNTYSLQTNQSGLIEDILDYSIQLYQRDEVEKAFELFTLFSNDTLTVEYLQIKADTLFLLQQYSESLECYKYMISNYKSEVIKGELCEYIKIFSKNEQINFYDQKRIIYEYFGMIEKLDAHDYVQFYQDEIDYEIEYEVPELYQGTTNQTVLDRIIDSGMFKDIKGYWLQEQRMPQKAVQFYDIALAIDSNSCDIQLLKEEAQILVQLNFKQ